ncbi:hypothetical protein BJX70DRAFT_354792 [Aspergillus crustosus]
MSQKASEVVFALQGGGDEPESCVFPYDYGPLRLKAPRKRGRPKGTISAKYRLRTDRIKTQDANPKRYDFVNYTGAVKDDSSSRKVIQRNAMLHHLREKRREDVEKIHTKIAKHGSPLLPQVHAVDPFNTAPLKMEPYVYDVLSYCCNFAWKDIFMVEQKAGVNPMADYWMPLAFHDTALLHAFIAFSGHYAGQNSVDPQPFIMHHLREAIAQSNARMANKTEAVSIETIVVIALVATIQNSHGISEKWEHSMQGLKMLIGSIDGGIDSLVEKPLVLGTIYRADLSGSIDTARAPFFAEQFKSPKTLDSQSLLLNAGFVGLEYANSTFLNQRIKHSIHRLESTITSMRRLYGRNMADAAKCRLIFVACQYDLLSFRCTDPVDELCRLSLITYTLAILDERPQKEPAYRQLVVDFQNLWDQVDSLPNPKPTLTPQFKLWSMVVAISITRSPEFLNWCLWGTTCSLTYLGISTMSAFIAALGDFLPVCDYRCAEVWLQCQEACAQFTQIEAIE